MHTTARPETHASVLAAMVRERRLELGLSKSAAARLAGVDRGTWHDIENGTRTNMLPDTLNQIDRALGFETGHLRRLSRPLDAQEADEDEHLRRRLIAFASSGSTAQIRRVLDLMEHDPLDTRPLSPADLDPGAVAIIYQAVAEALGVRNDGPAKQRVV